MRLTSDAVGEVVARLRRAEAAIHQIIATLDTNPDCTDVAEQMATVSQELDRVGFHIVASGLQQCAAAQSTGQDRTEEMQRMQKLFLSLT